MLSTKHLLICSLMFSSAIADWYHNTKAFEINNENYESLIGKGKNVEF